MDIKFKALFLLADKESKIVLKYETFYRKSFLGIVLISLSFLLWICENFRRLFCWSVYNTTVKEIFKLPSLLCSLFFV